MFSWEEIKSPKEIMFKLGEVTVPLGCVYICLLSELLDMIIETFVSDNAIGTRNHNRVSSTMKSYIITSAINGGQDNKYVVF